MNIQENNRIYKPLIITLIAVLSLAMLLLSWWGMYRLGRRSAQPPPAPETTAQPTADGTVRTTESTAQSTQPTQAALYIIGQWEGQVALFYPESNLPEKVYDTYVAALPLSEQHKLESGIPVYSEQELAGYLEDFTS